MNVTAVVRKTPKSNRPAEKVLRELGGKDIRWNVDKHLAGCLRAYEQNPSYGTAVYFALEAIAGIGREGMRRAESKELPQEFKDPEWGLSPTHKISVPWIWIRAVTEAWERYKDGDEGLGKAFGQEGGQGKPPISKKQDTRLDHRAIATWTWHKVQDERISITRAKGEAVGHFDLADNTIRKIWDTHGRFVKHSSH